MKTFIRLSIISLVLLLSTNKIHSQITANFTADTLKGCAPFTLVTFTNTSTGTINKVSWDFNANGTIDLEGIPAVLPILNSPTWNFPTPGIYSIRLVVADTISGIEDEIIFDNYISSFQGPTADFVASETSGCGILDVIFSDQTEQGGSDIISRSWSFGNGEGGSQQNPEVHYENGTSITVNYQVTLVVVDENTCSSNETKNNYITLNPGVIPAFELDPPGGCEPPVKIKVNNLSEGIGSLTYSWDFGNGETSNVANPDSITYTDFGTYPVVLILTSDLCVKTLTKTVSIANDFDVSFEYASNCEGKITRFTNTSDNVYDDFSWDFGDGGSSVSENPKHVYAVAGEYTVTLTASIGGNCIVVYSEVITVAEPESIEYADDEYVVCEFPTNIFVNVFNDNLDSLNWVVNDENGNIIFLGGYPVIMEFTEDVPLGTYYLSMTAYFETGCEDTLETPIPIYVAAPDVGGLIEIPDNLCLPFDGTFIDTSSFLFGIDSILWIMQQDTIVFQSNDSVAVYNFHDNTLVADTGEYIFSLTVYTPQGCAVTVQIDTIEVGMHTFPEFIWRHPDLANGEDTIKMCYRDTLGFTYTGPISSQTDTIIPHEWEYMIDISSTDTNPRAQFIRPDTTYTVSLVTKHFGCRDTIEHFIDSIIGLGPIAQFLMDSTFFCIYDTLYEVNFTNTSEFDTLNTTFDWGFGDGNTSSLMDPDSNIYPSPGLYAPYLIVSSLYDINGVETSCPDTIEFPEVSLIIIDYYELLNLNSLVGGFDFCNNASTLLEVNLSSTYFLPQYTQNTWDFGDSTDQELTFFNAEEVSHAYEEPGTYNLTVIGTNGPCFDTLVQVVNVYVEPTAGFSFDTTSVCAPTVVQVFDASEQGDGIITEWQYLSNPPQIPSAPETPDSEISITHSQDYEVLLAVEDEFGCKDNVLNTIKVHDINIEVDNQNACSNVPYSVDFILGEIDFEPLAFEWSFGNGETDTTDTPEVLFADIEKDTIFFNSVVITDTTGCTDTVFFEIELTIAQIFAFNRPGELFCDADQSFAEIDTITVLTGEMSIVETIIIEFGDGTNTAIDSSAVIDFLHTYTKPGKFDVTITVIDTNGCSVTKVYPEWIEVQGPLVNPFYTRLDSCPPLNVQFDVEDPVNVTGYTWLFGENGPTEDSPNPLHTYKHTGVFYPELWASAEFIDDEGILHSCTVIYDKMDSIRIDGPTMDFILESDVNCEGLEVNIDNLSENPDTNEFIVEQWVWDFGDGTLEVQETVDPENPLPHLYVEGGDFTITLTGFTADGICSYVYEDTTIYIVPSLDINPGFDVSTGCAPLSVSFTPDVDGDFELVTDPFWEFGDDSTAAEMEPTHKYFQPGTAFVVTFSYSYSECPFDVEVSNTVNTFADPLAGFTFLPNIENNAVATYEVTNQSEGEATVDWILDGVVISNENTLNVPVLEEGSTLSLIAFSNKNCTDTIEVTLEPIEYINIITPNGDTFNDELVFELSEDQMQCTSLNVFNRWGKLVYADGSYTNDWKGVNNSGNDLDDGTYFYILEICGRGAIKGYVTIVR